MSFPTNKSTHFVYLLDTTVRHWILSVQASNTFVMSKEQRVEVPIDFASKDLYLTTYIEFYKSIAISWQKKQLYFIELMKGTRRYNHFLNAIFLDIHKQSACRDTVETLEQLKDKHKNGLRSATSGNGNFTNSVKPEII